MNEFEWLKQTRALKQPIAPRTDLWSGIAERIDPSAAPAPARRPRLLPWAMAASVAAISLLAGSLAWHQTPVSTPRMAVHSTPATVTPWRPHDPRLVGAAIELNSARRALVRAIHRAPRDTYLQRMLLNTNRQLQRLQQLQHRAG
ncbi:MAG TPA: hypothetical protein VFJ15_01360 [Oleiagrimonas sp.]|nr:hypothetical protein [Oleiagrimonas sp.]